MERWQGKVAVITGASDGIGAAISKKLTNAGLHVVGLGRNEERLEKLSAELKNQLGKFFPFKADVTKEEDILKAFQWTEANFGPVHVLVNSAGVMENSNLTDGSTEIWKKIMDTNVISLCVTTREAVKSMRKHGVDGHIIHMNSVCGHKVVQCVELNVYQASKWAVTALTETLRLELNSIGSKIKISSISPGHVNTDMSMKGGLGFSTVEFLTITAEDVADSTLFVLGTPPHVQIHELIIKPVGEIP
ncbi:hypothetical protein RI129_010617 [Pyrocoelia pectoralis]|uniref:Farnesol dehydrogenase n=1 Tax=Pyrocoelia pectoralis TaxID=417401 RepID=A0AAN7V6J8_9COLE